MQFGRHHEYGFPLCAYCEKCPAVSQPPVSARPLLCRGHFPQLIMASIFRQLFDMTRSHSRPFGSCPLCRRNSLWKVEPSSASGSLQTGISLWLISTEQPLYETCCCHVVKRLEVGVDEMGDGVRCVCDTHTILFCFVLWFVILSA